MLRPGVLDTVLGNIEAEAVSSAVLLLRQRVNVPPSALGVAAGDDGEPVLTLLPILDLTQRYEALQAAVTAAKAEGFVFLFDGVVRGLDGSHDALLIVTCTRLWRRAKAILYRHSVDGLLVNDPVEAPDNIAAEYQRALHVHPEPHPGRPH
jgi:hypothetical protein